MVAPRTASCSTDPYNSGQRGGDGVRKDIQVMFLFLIYLCSKNTQKEFLTQWTKINLC